MPPTTSPVLVSGRRGAARPRGVTEITASPGSVPVAISSSAAPGHLAAERAGARHGGAGDGAVVDALELVGAVSPEPDRALPVHREAHPGAPAEPAGVAGHRLDLDGALDPRQPCQLLGDAEGLEPALRAELHVLEVAAPAAAGSGVRARRVDPVGGGGQDLDGVGPQVRGRAGGHSGPDPLAGEGVPDEDDPAVGSPRHAAAAGGDGPDLELQEARVVRGWPWPCSVGRRSWPRFPGHGVSIRPPPDRRRSETNPNEEDPMRYLLLIAGDESQFATATAEQGAAMMSEYADYSKEMADRGVLQGGERLRPTSDATTVRVRNGETLSTDGPFAETKEQLAGFYLVDCKDLDEAIEVAAKIPGARTGSIEVRPIWEM